MHPFPFLTDDEIKEIVKPLVQPAAILRWFRNNGFDNVKVKPNGMPLISRSYFEEVTSTATTPPAGKQTETGNQPDPAALLARIGPEAKAQRAAARAVRKTPRTKP